ncbi:polyprenyl synthetase family protein [Thermostilla marina]
MTQSIENIGNRPKELRALYDAIRPEMEEVERRLQDELQSQCVFIDRMLRHGFQLGGKRLRPALVLLTAKACGGTTDDHIVLATAVEMIHSATLIHDDVLDEATIRRHLETVNARWDNEASVLLGDYLLARAICLASSLDTPDACREIAQASLLTCQGELRQVAARRNFELTEEAYLDIISEKTAELCACCCRLGARYAGADRDTEETFYRFGAALGIAFQIVDDILDICGTEEEMGKSLGTDLVKQKPTLPLIRVLETASADDRKAVVEILSAQEVDYRDKLRPYFEKYDALGYAEEKARRFIAEAVSHLESLPAHPVIEALRCLADFVITRHQ